VLTGVLAGRTLTDMLAERRVATLPASLRGAVMDTAYGALRYRGELEAMLAVLLKKPLDVPDVHALLLAALYQLRHTRMAAYAVVDNAVNAAPRKFGALVNAILRNAQRRDAELSAAVQRSETGSYNHAGWWLDALRRDYPDDWQAIARAGNQHPPLTLRVNRRRDTPDAALARLQDAGIDAYSLGHDALRIAQPVPVDRLPGFADGKLSVQDAGAQYAARLLDVHDGQRTLDACAAPGGKTGHLLELAALDLHALDADAVRLDRVASNLGRLGLQASLRCGDASRPQDWWDGSPYDRILADVPCSASGVVRRHPDIKWHRRDTDLVVFARQQARILHALWSTLAPGGKLLYATCSLFAVENQAITAAFLAQQSDARALPMADLPASGQLLPNDEHDGFYYCLLQKS
jgi:16S rRNA (cytosine967-C5)-methyltransferase